MLIIRPARESDLEQLLAISEHTGSGMTTMPSDRNSWESKLAKSVASFAFPTQQAKGETYFLVMEDTDIQSIAGTCAIYAGIGLDRPFYSYKLSTLTKASKEINITVHMKVLYLVNDYTEATEIGSLFLLPQYRQNGNGRFLSRCRQLMIADFPERFSEIIFAELRGWLEENGRSPFWEHLGRKFFKLSYEEADYLSAVKGYQFISDLMPEYPIYVDLLPPEAQAVIGKVHKDGTAALKLLQKEGFQYTGYIDIFDAGPCVQCNRDQIYSVANSKTAFINSITDNNKSKPASTDSYIISNCNIDHYRMVAQPLQILSENEIIIETQSAEILNVKTGDKLRYIKL